MAAVQGKPAMYRGGAAPEEGQMYLQPQSIQVQNLTTDKVYIAESIRLKENTSPHSARWRSVYPGADLNPQFARAFENEVAIYLKSTAHKTVMGPKGIILPSLTVVNFLRVRVEEGIAAPEGDKDLMALERARVRSLFGFAAIISKGWHWRPGAVLKDQSCDHAGHMGGGTTTFNRGHQVIRAGDPVIWDMPIPDLDACRPLADDPNILLVATRPFDPTDAGIHKNLATLAEKVFGRVERNDVPSYVKLAVRLSDNRRTGAFAHWEILLSLILLYPVAGSKMLDFLAHSEGGGGFRQWVNAVPELPEDLRLAGANQDVAYRKMIKVYECCKAE